MTEELKAIDFLRAKTISYECDAIELHYSLVLYNLIMSLQAKNQELKNQQKEFIDWLTNESKELIRDAGYHQRICLDILSKYKEIIGKDINVSNKN